MVPWWTLVLLTAGFFIREVYRRSKKSNYGEGYRRALIELSTEWNRLCKKSMPYKNFISQYQEFFQKKLKEGDFVD